MIGKESSIEWLARQREEYRSTKNGMGGIVKDFDEVGKLGRGFVSIDELEDVGIGSERGGGGERENGPRT
jgi:hypothetical protein